MRNKVKRLDAHQDETQGRRDDREREDWGLSHRPLYTGLIRNGRSRRLARRPTNWPAIVAGPPNRTRDRRRRNPSMRSPTHLLHPRRRFVATEPRQGRRRITDGQDHASWTGPLLGA